jgi:hypothetical protein
MVFGLDFVEDLPVRDPVVIAGFVAHAEFVDEATLRIPTNQAGVVAGDIVAGRIEQLGALTFAAEKLIGVGGDHDWLRSLEKPTGIVLKFRIGEWPSVACRKSSIIGSMREKSQEVLPSFGDSSSATANLG